MYNYINERKNGERWGRFTHLSHCELRHNLKFVYYEEVL